MRGGRAQRSRWAFFNGLPRLDPTTPYILIQGRAKLLTKGENYRRALLLLHKKYPQYRHMAIQDKPMIQIKPTRCKSWGDL